MPRARRRKAIPVFKLRSSKLKAKVGDCNALQKTPQHSKRPQYVYFPMFIDESQRKIATMLMLVANFGAFAASISSLYFAGESCLFVSSERTILDDNSWVSLSTQGLTWYNWWLLFEHLLVFIPMHYIRFNRTRIKMIRNSTFSKLIFFDAVIVILLTVALSVIIFRIQYKIEEEFTESMKKLMRHYRQGKDYTKESNLVDFVQIEYYCCGAVNYTDWFSSAIWKKQLMGCSRNSATGRTYPFIPFSCCNSSSQVFCMHYTPRDIFEGSKHDFLKYNHYKDGCATKSFHNFIKFIHNMIISWAVMLSLNSFFLLSLQYLGTSIHFALLWSRRADNTGMGWIYGPPMQRLDLAALVMEHRNWAWRIEVKYKPMDTTNVNSNPLSGVSQEELESANQLRMKNGLVSTFDGANGFGVTPSSRKENHSENAIEKVCSKIESQYKS